MIFPSKNKAIVVVIQKRIIIALMHIFPAAQEGVLYTHFLSHIRWSAGWNDSRGLVWERRTIAGGRSMNWNRASGQNNLAGQQGNRLDWARVERAESLTTTGRFFGQIQKAEPLVRKHQRPLFHNKPSWMAIMDVFNARVSRCNYRKVLAHILCAHDHQELSCAILRTHHLGIQSDAKGEVPMR